MDGSGTHASLSPISETRNIKLAIQYDGTHFHGWQIQPKLRTVQGTITQTLTKVLDQDIKLIGAGRTDTGVHALGQVANFQCVSSMPAIRIRAALNSILFNDIRIIAAEDVDRDFHARFSAVSRSYRYRIGTSEQSQSPFRFRYYHQITYDIQFEKMCTATQLLIGNHNFSAFVKQDNEITDYHCEVTAAHWRKTSAGYSFEITANRFLHQMVRRIVGALLDIGTGKLPMDDFQKLIASANRRLKTKPAPASGLFLVAVSY